MPTIRSLADRLNAKLDKSAGPEGCWPFTGYRQYEGKTHPMGYGMIGRGPGAKPKLGMTHRVAWELANGPIPAGLFVCHKCDNPPCCNPAHLFLGTAAENSRDMCRKSRAFSRLSPDSVREIRAQLALGATQASLARLYGIGHVSIWRIAHGECWKHL